MNKLNEHDASMMERVAKVEAAGGCLHYAAKVDVAQNKVEVGLLSCEASHPFNNAGPDNMVAITTNFYTRPLVVQGAGSSRNANDALSCMPSCSEIDGRFLILAVGDDFSDKTACQIIICPRSFVTVSIMFASHVFVVIEIVEPAGVCYFVQS